jgi:hypothetical protein
MTKMMLIDGRIWMSEKEWEDFCKATWAPWRPRTPAEFNAMCDLGAARHEAEDTDGLAFMRAIECEQMRFGPNGEINFPIDERKVAYCKLHGVWPTDEQLRGHLEEEGTPVAQGKLELVKKS